MDFRGGAYLRPYFFQFEIPQGKWMNEVKGEECAMTRWGQILWDHNGYKTIDGVVPERGYGRRP
jgi:hypothetical protein